MAPIVPRPVGQVQHGDGAAAVIDSSPDYQHAERSSAQGSQRPAKGNKWNEAKLGVTRGHELKCTAPQYTTILRKKLAIYIYIYIYYISK